LQICGGVFVQDWKIFSLGDVCESLSDGLHKAPQFIPDGEYLFVNAKNLQRGFIVDSNDGKRTNYSEYQKYKIELNKN